MSEFASHAAEKLRKQGSLAIHLLVFAYALPFRPGPRFNKSVAMLLRRPTGDTGKLVWAAAMGMRRMYLPGCKMAKAGWMLLDQLPGSVLQGAGSEGRKPAGPHQADGGAGHAQWAVWQGDRGLS